mmetsp:Transcript_886/g.2481  ORF Transcript_886/g.2481 Transcript_886/m.2481 type:complete len:208 (-) Transcript_886:1056-1679(-)
MPPPLVVDKARRPVHPGHVGVQNAAARQDDGGVESLPVLDHEEVAGPPHGPDRHVGHVEVPFGPLLAAVPLDVHPGRGVHPILLAVDEHHLRHLQPRNALGQRMDGVGPGQEEAVQASLPAGGEDGVVVQVVDQGRPFLRTLDSRQPLVDVALHAHHPLRLADGPDDGAGGPPGIEEGLGHPLGHLGHDGDVGRRGRGRQLAALGIA